VWITHSWLDEDEVEAEGEAMAFHWPVKQDMKIASFITNQGAIGQ